MTDNIDKYNKGNATVKNGADDQKSDKTDNLENNIEDNERKMVDVIIPTYRPAKEFGELLHRLEKQEYRPNRILVMNTGKEYWNSEWENYPLLEVYHLDQKDFDHGGTRKRAAELLEIVGLGDRQNAYPAQLSGGQKQRVAIARALASDPKILLCDEATSALDPQTTSSILELLKKINKQFGITIVIITHQMSVVREICTHVAIMYEGEVVEKGLVADIFANPQSEVAKELIRKDTGSDIDVDSRLDAGREKGQAEIKSGEKIRIVFSENSAFEPVIANLILTFGEPVNILKADTKNVGGVAKGEMILEFMEGSTRTEMMKQYLKEKGLAIGEVTEYVGS